MEEIIQAVVNNGLGVASFLALIIYIFKYQTKANETLDDISKTLIQLSERLSLLEKEKDKKEK